MDTTAQPPAKSIVKKILRFFMQGLLILAPIAITVWAIIAAFNFVDDLLPNLINKLFPSWIKEDANGNVKNTRAWFCGSNRLCNFCRLDKLQFPDGQLY